MNIAVDFSDRLNASGGGGTRPDPRPVGGTRPGAHGGTREGNRRAQTSGARAPAALAEKEVLLREVHHRVKNFEHDREHPLLPGQDAESKKALAAFQDSQNRIHSMARIHEHLYSSPSLTQINMVLYFRDLTVHLQQTFGSKPIAIHIDASKKIWEIDQAIPCG